MSEIRLPNTPDRMTVIYYIIYIFHIVVSMTYVSFRKELTIKWNAIYYKLCQYKQCKLYDVKQKKSNT